jgi:hypothetical protein
MYQNQKQSICAENEYLCYIDREKEQKNHFCSQFSCHTYKCVVALWGIYIMYKTYIYM